MAVNDASATAPAVRLAGPVPLIIGVTGHTNLVQTELPGIAARVREFFRQTLGVSPDLPPLLVSGLAEGADRLVAREALTLGIPLLVVLPMPRDIYVADFKTTESLEEFNRLCGRGEILELPLRDDADAALLAHDQDARNRQYAQLGVFVSAHCHILLALWDGKESVRIGGTAQVVHFHRHDLMPGYTTDTKNYRNLLEDNAGDLIYHITVSRDGPNGSPMAPLGALQASWWTKDEFTPRSEFLPQRHRLIFSRMAEFNGNAARFSDSIGSGGYHLPVPIADPDAGSLETIDRLFVAADWLAGHFQRQFHRMLRLTHVVAVLMGAAYVGYSDVTAEPVFIALFLAMFAIGLVVFGVAGRRAWQRKYLDYRALAEGLRVQFFWAMAGIHRDEVSRFAHDNFLYKQDAELGWIRNIMCVAGLRRDASDRVAPDGLEQAARTWIGDERDGQIGYYSRKGLQYSTLQSRTEFIGMSCVSIGITVALGLLLYQRELSANAQTVLSVLMAILPLIAATRNSYSEKKAEKELVRQYKFMHRVFRSGRRQLMAAANDQERREILRAVGEAALEEHAEWILMHRERPIEFSKL